MIPWLNDDDHERLWRICDRLVSEGGARAAVLCDAENGSVVISVGEAGASGSVTGVESLAPGERLIHGAAGEIYGVDVPGGGLLAVLHDPQALEKVRTAAAEAVQNMANLLTTLPVPGKHEHEHAHEHAVPKTKTRAKKKKGSVAKKARPSKAAKKRKPSPRPRRPAKRRSTRT